MATGNNYRMREKSENNFIVVCQEEQQENRYGIVFYMLPSNRPHLQEFPSNRLVHCQVPSQLFYLLLELLGPGIVLLAESLLLLTAQGG